MYFFPVGGSNSVFYQFSNGPCQKKKKQHNLTIEMKRAATAATTTTTTITTTKTSESGKPQIKRRNNFWRFGANKREKKKVTYVEIFLRY